MPRIKRIMAACAAVSVAVSVAAAPAPAQTDQVTIRIDPNPCVADPSLPTCVNYVFDATVRALEVTRDTYHNEVQPALNDPACKAYEIATDEPCPQEALIPHFPLK